MESKIKAPKISQSANNIASPSPTPAISNYVRMSSEGKIGYLKLLLFQESAKYGISYQEIYATAMCESGFQIDPKHNNISWGIMQFTPATWKEFGHGNIMDAENQILVATSMWNKWETYKGKQRQLKERWDCFRLGLYKKYLK